MKKILECHLAIITILFVSLFLIHCSSSEDHQIDPSKYSSDIEAVWNYFKVQWEEEDAKELSTFYTEDGVNNPSNETINRGREEIASFYQWLFDDHISSVYEHTIDSLYYEDNILKELGHFKVDWVRNDSSAWNFQASSKTAWVKIDDAWKIERFDYELDRVQKRFTKD